MTYEQIAGRLRGHQMDDLSGAVIELGAMHQKCLSKISEMGGKIKELESQLLISKKPVDGDIYSCEETGRDIFVSREADLLGQILDMLIEIRNNQVLD